jgi:hypothetical protein
MRRNSFSLLLPLLCTVLLCLAPFGTDAKFLRSGGIANGSPSPTCRSPTVTVDNPTPTAGSVVNVTVCGGPGNAKDFVQLAINYNRQAFGPFFYLNGATGGTFSFTIPQIAQDRPASYVALFNANDSNYQELGEAVITVPATISPPAPTSTLPKALAADPFVPAHTVTVCASGCNYTNLGDATDATSTLDNVLIKVSSGEYPFPANRLSANYSPHLWIKGVGPTMPHFYGKTSTSGEIIDTHLGACGSSITLDNLEFGPWNYWALVSSDCITFTMRNSYIHDTPEGMITGNRSHMTLNLYNDVFARHGTGNGPEHDIYIGEGDNTNVVTVKNSVFEQSHVGHAFKERAKTVTANCSMFLVNYDTLYLGSETIDPSDGGSVTLTNILSASGGANQSWSANSAWDQMRYGAEGDIAGYTNAPIVTGSTFLTDETSGTHDMIGLYTRITSPPVTWSNNKFIFPAAATTYGNGNQNAIVSCPADRNCNSSDITIDGTNTLFTSRAAAGLPPVSYPKGWRDFLPMMPAACTDPIGNVAMPAS